MQAFAEQFLKQIQPNTTSATVIGLRGDLGAGKTTFTKACASLLGVSETVTSPTFVILKKYAINNPDFSKTFSFFIHIDAYRLKGGSELNVIGWQEFISDPKNLIFIEWPELVMDVMPANTKYVDFKHIDETTREITL